MHFNQNFDICFSREQADAIGINQKDKIMQLSHGCIPVM